MINRSLQAIQGRLSPRVLGASFVLLEQRRFRQYWGGGSHDSCCNCSYHPCFYRVTLNIGIRCVLWHSAFPSAQAKNLVLLVEDGCVTCITSGSLQGYRFFQVPCRVQESPWPCWAPHQLALYSVSSSFSTDRHSKAFRAPSETTLSLAYYSDATKCPFNFPDMQSWTAARSWVAWER